MAIHNSGEKGMRNAKSGISVLTFGAANKEMPLWKYGALKSITSARILPNGKDFVKFGGKLNVAEGETYLVTLSGANDMSAEPTTKSPTIPFHTDWSWSFLLNRRLFLSFLSRSLSRRCS